MTEKLPWHLLPFSDRIDAPARVHSEGDPVPPMSERYRMHLEEVFARDIAATFNLEGTYDYLVIDPPKSGKGRKS